MHALSVHLKKMPSPHIKQSLFYCMGNATDVV
jgi:hypothetical protein